MNTQQWSDVARYKNEIENGETIAIIWCIEDVYTQAEDDGIDDLTHEEAMSVLDRLYRKHDATIGINWDTLSYWIEEVRGERP